MPQFRGVELWSEKRCIAGAKRLAYFPELARESDGCLDIEAVEADESLTVKLPTPAADTAGVAQGLVIAEAFDDESFKEWRIDTIAVTRTVTTIVAKSILNDLTDDELLVDLDASGFPTFTGGLASVTATEALEFMLAHPRVVAAGIPTWLRIGMVDSTRALDAVEYDTAGILAFCRAVQTAVRGSGESCELEVIPDPAAPATGYVINLVEQIGASATVPTFVTGRNLVGDLANTSARRDQSTVVIVRGGELSGLNTGIGLSRWPVTAITGTGPYVVTLADLVAGGKGPIGVDDQFNGQAILREADATLQTITDCSASAQTVTLSAIGSLGVGDIIQFRTTNDPATATPLVELAHPARVALYGRKIGTFKRPSVIGVPNLVPNPFFRTWTDPTLLPDGWAFSTDLGNDGVTTAPADYGAFVTIAKNTDARFTQRVGGQSLQFSIAQGTLMTPPVRWAPTYTGQRFSVVLRIFLTTFNNPASLIRLNLGIRLADGTVHRWWEAERTLWAQPTTGQRPTPQFQKLPTNAWSSIGLANEDMSAASTVSSAFIRVTAADIAAIASGGADGFVLCLFAGGNGGAERIEGYLDAVMMNPGPVTPDALTEFGGSNVLHQTGNLVLNEVSAPAVEITSSVLDLERSNPDTYAPELLQKGATSLLLDPRVDAADNRLRMIQLERDRINPMATKVTWSSRRRLFTDLLLQSGGGVLLGTGSGAATSSGSSSSGGTTVTSAGGSSAPTIVLDGSIASDVPSVAATVSPGVTRVRIAGSTTPFADETAATAAVDAETDITTFPASKTFAAISPGDTEYVAASAWDLNGVRSALAQTSINDPAPADPGVQVDTMLIDMADSFDAGSNQSLNRWAFVEGSPSWSGGRVTEGDGFVYFQHAPVDVTHQNDYTVTFALDLNGQTLPAYNSPLIRFSGPLKGSGIIILTLRPDRTLEFVMWNGSAYVAIGTPSTTAWPSTGETYGEVRVHLDASAGFAWARMANTLATHADTLDFSSVVASGINDIAIGTGSGDDYGGYDPAAHAGGIPNVIWNDVAIHNPNGAAQYDFAGQVKLAKVAPVAAGTYNDSGAAASDVATDDGVTSYANLTATSQKDTWTVAAPVSGIVTILGVMVYGYWAAHHTSGATAGPCNFRLVLKSGATLVDNGADITAGTSYSSKLGTSSTQERWSVATDPATSVAWTVSGLTNLEAGYQAVSIPTTGGSVNEIRMSQTGVEYAYRT